MGVSVVSNQKTIEQIINENESRISDRKTGDLGRTIFSISW